MARRSTYTEAVADEICERIAAGESLLRICEDDAMPTDRTVYKWLSQNDLFVQRYARAREMQAERYAEQIVEIADDGRNDTYTNEDGDEVVNYDHIQRSKLRVDARKWIACKLLPKKYGDKIDHNHGGKVTLEQILEQSGEDGRPEQD